MTDDEHTVMMREKILSAAEKAFEVGGYTQTTIDAVAAEAGIAKGSIYNYFHSKRDLFIGVFTRTMDIQRNQTEQLLQQQLSASDKMLAILNDWYSQMSYYKQIGRLFLEFWATAARDDREGEISTTTMRVYDNWRNVLVPIIVEGMESGEFRGDFDPEIAATLIMSIADGVIIHAILDFGIDLNQQLFTAITRAVLAGLGASRPKD